MSSSNSTFRVLKEWFFAVVVALLLAAVVRIFLFAPYEVSGTSMYPTLDGNEMLLVNKIVYNLKKPAYGDIIVFHTNEQRDFIKRVIGLPGDKIAIHDGKVFRNGKELSEPYLSEETIGELKTITVPANQLFVLGDNRNNSKDSRVIGSIDMKDVVGRADAIVLPIQRMELLGH
jgi:signal peptidase I